MDSDQHYIFQVHAPKNPAHTTFLELPSGPLDSQSSSLPLTIFMDITPRVGTHERAIKGEDGCVLVYFFPADFFHWLTRVC